MLYLRTLTIIYFHFYNKNELQYSIEILKISIQYSPKPLNAPLSFDIHNIEL
jgi:hypothetical protein